MVRAPVCSVRQPRAANNTGRLSTSTAKTSHGASPTEGHVPPSELQCGNKVLDNARIAKGAIPRFDRESPVCPVDRDSQIIQLAQCGIDGGCRSRRPHNLKVNVL